MSADFSDVKIVHNFAEVIAHRVTVGSVKSAVFVMQLEAYCN